MNYQKIYDSLMSKARTRELDPGFYFERHHVVPRCMGGSDDPGNLVNLTAEEHFVAHQLLVKIYKGNNRLVYALNMMSTDTSRGRTNNKRYAWIRKAASETLRGVTPWNKGIPRSQEVKDKISASKKGKTVAPNKGKPHSEETKAKLKKAWESRERVKTRPPLSQETRDKISKSHMLRRAKIKQEKECHSP